MTSYLYKENEYSTIRVAIYGNLA